MTEKNKLLNQNFQSNGFEIFSHFISTEITMLIKEEIETLALPDFKGGIRNANKKFGTINNLVNSSHLIEKAKDYLLGEPKIVRVILFDKSPENNWMVPWHQDQTVAVSKKFECQNWGPWSIKDDVYHVQPPIDVLLDMITFRIHIDETNIDNGCLRVIPGSHQLGLLSTDEIQKFTKSASAVNCEGKEGALIVMRPHLLHASHKAKNKKIRRIIHIEYSSYPLPKGINWI